MTYTVLVSENGKLKLTAVYTLEDALHECKEYYHSLRHDLEDVTIRKEPIIAWNNGYGSENDRIRVNDNFKTLVRQHLRQNGNYLALSIQSPTVGKVVCKVLRLGNYY